MYSTYPKKTRKAKHLQTGEQELNSFMRETDTLTKDDELNEGFRNIYGPGTGEDPSGSRPEPKGIPHRPNIITAS